MRSVMGGGEQITSLLLAWSKGEHTALDRLIPLVYAELRHIASRHLVRELPGSPVHTTVLVHEAYLRLVDQEAVDWQNRAHFFGICARLMREILVDQARSRGRLKRGGNVRHLDLEEVAVVSLDQSEELIAIHEALEKLRAMDERKGRVVELRFFGGLSVEETAEVLGVAPNTVIRDWGFAKAWLGRELNT